MASRPDTGLIRPVVDKEHMLITDEQYVKLPSMFVVKKWGKPKDNEKVMVLTFDDGPDPEYTPKILISFLNTKFRQHSLYWGSRQNRIYLW